jgi:hypothetical protein
MIEWYGYGYIKNNNEEDLEEEDHKEISNKAIEG